MPRNEVLVKAHLCIALQTIVPLIIAELQASGGITEQDIARAQPLVKRLVDGVGHADDVLYSAKKPGTTTQRLGELARGVAILAFVPGGVDIFGLHFEAL
jgi:hypothetical protein